MKHRMLIAALSACLCAGASAQTEEHRPIGGPEDARMMRAQDDMVSFEPFCRSAGPDSAVVDVLFRFRRDALVFMRSPQQTSFDARAEVSIEIVDSAGVPSARFIRTISLSSEDNSPEVLRRSDEQGIATFHLKRGRYMALCMLTDQDAAHKQFARRIPVMIPRTGWVSSALLLARDTGASVITPQNLGGNAVFSQPLYAVAGIPARYRSLRAVYSLDAMKPEDEDAEPVKKDTAVTVRIIPHAALVPERDSVRGVFYRIEPDTSTSLVVVPLGGEELAQGRYMLRMKFDASGDTASLHSAFAMRWRDMPQSLRDLDFATAAMKYITTEDQYDELTSGRRSKRIAAFDAFWKKQDPTPGTAYNERLAEYFRRVDYAFQNFRTLKEENGVFTDRGKIFILYGAPGATERSLSPSNAPREVWRYPALNKLFTFEDPSRQGNYKLIPSSDHQ